MGVREEGMSNLALTISEIEKDVSGIITENATLKKENAELKAQIEKMKNCFNCAKGDWNNRANCIKSGCVNKDKWEIKEND